MRLITKAHYLANTAPLFSQLKVLDIFSINSFSVATFMYSYHHNLLPSSFRDLFLSSNQVHQSSASSKVYLIVYRKIDKTSELPKMTFLGQETVRKQHRDISLRDVHLDGSLCAFSPFYRRDLMIHSHINHVVSHSQDLDSFHITNTADKLFPVFHGLVHFISNRMFMFQY